MTKDAKVSCHRDLQLLVLSNTVQNATQDQGTKDMVNRHGQRSNTLKYGIQDINTAMFFYSKARFLSLEGTCTIVYHTMVQGPCHTMVRNFAWLWNRAYTGVHGYGNYGYGAALFAWLRYGACTVLWYGLCLAMERSLYHR